MAQQRKQQSRKKKSTNKRQPMSPTFKAGLVIILVMFMIWGVISSKQDAWYNKAMTNVESVRTEVINTAEEKQAIKVESVEQQSEPVKEETPVVEEKEEPKDQPKEPVIQGPIENFLNDSFDYNADVTSFDREHKYWSFRRNKEHEPVVGYSQGVDLDLYDAFHIVQTEDKVVYLTFDEGYERGYTERILDILRDNGVTAAFFVTDPYIKSVPELVKRMKEDGHVVANHSVHHYDGNSGDGTALTEIEPAEVVQELKGVEETMLEVTGYPIDLFFRPPGGVFTEQTLYLTRQQGYKTVFWSMAYQDWYVDNQPGKDVAYEHVMTNYHPGAVILLHAVSESNTEALDDIIKSLKAEGYRFGSLYEIPSKF